MYFKLDKTVVLSACEKFLADPSNVESDWYVDVVEVQRIYDMLKSNVYNHTQSVLLEVFEVELLCQYMEAV